MAQEAPISYPFTPPPSLYEPSPELAELRATRPVVQVTMPDGKTAWMVTRFNDVRQVLIDPRFSRASANSSDVPTTGLGSFVFETIIGMDPPEHTRLRKLVAKAFTARRVDQLRPRVAKLVDELIDAMEPLPRPVDLVEHFSLPLPVQVICELLGVPAADRHRFHGWSDQMMGDLNRDPKEMQTAFESLAAYFGELIEAKRAAPADDLMSALIAARDEGDKLSERELVVMGLSLLIAGHETTANQLNMFLLTLLRFPEELDKLRKDQDAIPRAVEELMRFVQLGEGSAGMPRVAREEVELSGVKIPAGAAVLPSIGSANRDPAMVEEPDRLDLSRPELSHLSFGAGVHHCLGAQLARMELQEGLRGILRRMPDIRVEVPDAELRFKHGMILRSLESLPVTW